MNPITNRKPRLTHCDKWQYHICTFAMDLLCDVFNMKWLQFHATESYSDATHTLIRNLELCFTVLDENLNHWCSCRCRLVLKGGSHLLSQTFCGSLNRRLFVPPEIVTKKVPNAIAALTITPIRWASSVLCMCRTLMLPVSSMYLLVSARNAVCSLSRRNKICNSLYGVWLFSVIHGVQET
jgi:hypothetical protein